MDREQKDAYPEGVILADIKAFFGVSDYRQCYR